MGVVLSLKNVEGSGKNKMASICESILDTEKSIEMGRMENGPKEYTALESRNETE